MRISVDGYADFKRVCASLGTLTHVFYSFVYTGSPSTAIYATLAIAKTGGIYVTSNAQGSVDVTQFLLDFPGAIEANNVGAAY